MTALPNTAYPDAVLPKHANPRLRCRTRPHRSYPQLDSTRTNTPELRCQCSPLHDWPFLDSTLVTTERARLALCCCLNRGSQRRGETFGVNFELLNCGHFDTESHRDVSASTK